MLRRKRTWDLIGCILGLSVLVVGLAFLTTPPDAYSTRSADYAVFGADYYTYQYEATQIVAENVATTANNLREIGTAFARYTGVFFIMSGALILIHYGKNYFVELESVQNIKSENMDCDDTIGSTEEANYQIAEE